MPKTKSCGSTRSPETHTPGSEGRIEVVPQDEGGGIERHLVDPHAAAFLGGTLPVHTPASTGQPAPVVDGEPAIPQVELHRADAPVPDPAPEVPELGPAPAVPSTPAPAPVAPPVPAALLDAGENIKAVSEYMGHADPGMTLRVYAHLMPDSRERARRAIDNLFQRRS